MAVKQVPLKDLQFGPKYEPEKARQLMLEVASLQRALNLLIKEWSTLSDAGETLAHDLAGTEGLGTSHTVSGLTPGQVLTAIAEDDAAFRALSLDDLSDVDASDPEQGQTLTFNAGRWEPSDLPDLTGLADPGANRLVWWNETDDALGFLKFGNGLSVSGTTLSVQTSALTHAQLSGLGSDDHPQYARLADDEVVLGAWDFEEPIDFLDGQNPGALERYRLGADDGFFLGIVDEGGSVYDVLALSRFASDVSDTLTFGYEDGQIRWELWGSAFLSADDTGLYIGAAGDLSLRYDGEHGYLTNALGTLYVLSDEAIDITTDLLEVHTPLLALVDAEAVADTGRWGSELALGMMRLAAFNDDGSLGEAWAQIMRTDSEIDSINFSASELRWNGALLFTVKDTGSIHLEPLATAPVGGENGDLYYDSTTSKFRGYAGGVWIDLH